MSFLTLAHATHPTSPHPTPNTNNNPLLSTPFSWRMVWIIRLWVRCFFTYFFTCFFTCFFTLVYAEEPVFPDLTSHVIDQALLLDSAAQMRLNQRLIDLEKQHGTQMVVVILPTTQPLDIVSYTQQLGDTWQLGRQNVGDGLLLVIATQDRKVRLATTKALEGVIPDVVAKRIISNTITPAFQRRDWEAGLAGAIAAIQERLNHEQPQIAPNTTSPPHHPSSSTTQQDGLDGFSEDDWVFLLLAVPIIALILGRVLGRFLGPIAASLATGWIAWQTSSLLLLTGSAAFLGFLVAWWSSRSNGSALTRRSHFQGSAPIWTISSNSGSGGWGSGSSGTDSGGFSSGGGGDFGGGGASGDW